jgi:hypothetical protein
LFLTRRLSFGASGSLRTERVVGSQASELSDPQVRSTEAVDVYVSFLWTLPSFRVGFDDLPKDTKEAAKRSWTIRYQRERLRIWAQENAGRIADEISFMETSPDRGTKSIKEGLAKAHEACLRYNAALLYVDFSMRFGWRPHPDLLEYLQRFAIPSLPVAPDAITVAGEKLDPVFHFRRWRREDETAQRREKARRDVLAMGGGNSKAVADALNASGSRTAMGRLWTASNVQKLRDRHRSAEGEIPLRDTSTAGSAAS